MLFLPSGSPLNSPNQTAILLSTVLANSEVAACASEFLTSTTDSASISNRKHVFVKQSELAQVDLARDESVVVGSDSATTCVIAVAVCLETQCVCVVHFDESTAVPWGFKRWLRGMRKPSVFLVGAYEDEESIGERISNEILGHLHSRDDIMATLSLACLGHINTQPDGSPKCFALSVDCSTLRPTALSIGASTPASLQRRAKFWCGYSRDLQEVYNTEAMQFELEGYSANVSIYTRMFMERMLTLPDGVMIEHVSTSPKHEPPDFIQGIRETFRWILSLTSETCNVPDKKFEWSPGNGWREIEAAKYQNSHSNSNNSVHAFAD